MAKYTPMQVAAANRAAWMMGISAGEAVTPKNVRSAIFRGIGLDDTGRLAKDQLRTGDRRTLQPGRCYLFDGVDDRIVGPAMDSGLVSTITFWAKLTAMPADAQRYTIFSNSYMNTEINVSGIGGTSLQWLLYYGAGHTAGSPTLGVNYTFHSSGLAIPVVGEWGHFAIVIDRTTGRSKFYKNGILGADTVNDYAFTTNTKSTFEASIGSRTASQYLNGRLFDLRVYDSELTAAQIAAIYNKNEETQNYPTPVAWYKCDDVNRSVAYDSSGNGYHGTKTNTAYAFQYSGKDVPRSFANDIGSSQKLVKASFGNVGQTGGFATAATITTGQTSHDGSADAILLTNTGTGGRIIYTNTTPAGANAIEATVYLKPGNDNGASVLLYNFGTATTLTQFTIDLTNGSGAATYAHSKCVWKAIGNGWAKVTITYEGIAAAGNNIGFYIYPQSSGGPSGTTLYVSDWTMDFYANAPRDEANPTQDVLGNALQYTGPAPRDAKLIKSHCATFDGVDDGINVPKAGLQPTTAVTMSAWIKPGTVSGQDRILTMPTDTATLYFNGSLDGLTFYVNTTSTGRLVAFNRSIAAGVWTHVAVTYDSTTGWIYGYVDGEQVVSNLFSGTILVGESEFGIGNNGVNSHHFSGSIADARLYETALSPENIFAIYRGESVNATPLGHWPLAEGAGTTAFDVSGNNRHGTVKNANLATFWGTTQDNYHRNIAIGFDQVLEFDGVNDKIESVANVPLMPTNATTIAFWAFLPSSNAAQQNIVTMNGLAVYKNGSTQKVSLYTHTDTNMLHSSAVMPRDRWCHIVATYDNGTAKVYIDGVLDNTTTGNASNLSAGAVQKLFVGVASNGTSSWVTGRLRDVRIYNQAVSASDASVLALGADIILQPVLHLPLNEGSGTTAVDIAGGNNGTITGATWTKQPAAAKNVSLIDDGGVDRPAGNWHNGAETHLDFTNGEPNQPWTNGLTVPTDYAFGGSLVAPITKKATAKTEQEFHFYNP